MENNKKINNKPILKSNNIFNKNNLKRELKSLKATEEILSSEIQNDSNLKPLEGINSWKYAIDQIFNGLETVAEGNANFPKLILNGETITEWPSEGVSLTSELTDDSKTNINSGINPWKRSIDILRNDFVSLQTGKTNFLAINLNGETITKWSDISSEGISKTSELEDDSTEKPIVGINPWKTQIDSNKDNIFRMGSGEYNFSRITLNNETIIEWPEGGATLSSELTDDSVTNPTQGINPWKTQIDSNKNDIFGMRSGKYEFSKITLNDETITEWPESGATVSSELTNDSNINPSLGINPMLFEIDKNTTDISIIEQGAYNYPQLTLNGKTINQWPEFEEGISKSSELTDDSVTNPTQGINPWKTQIDENTEDISKIIDGTILTNSVSSSTEDDSTSNPTFGINPWKTQIDKNASNILLKANQVDLDKIESGTYNYSKLTLNGEEITKWPDEGISKSSELTNDSNINPSLGINPMLFEIDKNTTDISIIEQGAYNYPKITLNGEEITKWSEAGISLSSMITDDSNTNPNLGINSLLNQIINNQNKILDLENKMEDLKSPIGTIIISVLPPSYGVWTVLGTLEDGQAIIGGSSSNGSIISHNHQWSAGVTSFTAGLVIGIGNSINRFNTYDQTGNAKSIGSKVLLDNNDSTQTGWTSLTGAESKNKAYGLGIGTGMRIFRRTA
ncbi:MAG: hypothetical protein HPAVJP_2990 [Candidatus Hepatoplasma vulgare]|nr:MAG: hypothetical protein HPAVJP_2990 [Candidatus Hepatoplasma sp.]